MATPTIGVIIDWANGPAFGLPIVLDDSLSGKLDTGILADQPSDTVDVSDVALSISIRRGRNRILSKFEAGTATVILNDDNADFSASNTASPYYGKLIPLRKIRIYADYDDGNGTVRYYLFSGYITSFQTSFALGLGETTRVTLQCVDGFRLLQGASIDSVPLGIAGQYSGNRVSTLLDLVSYPSSMRLIDQGLSTMQADPGGSRALLDACVTVGDSEFGAFFLDPSGNAVFYSRDTVAKKADATPYDFSDDGTAIDYSQIEFAYDDQLIVNDVSVTRLNGVLQNVMDTDSINSYFIHSGTRTGILVQSDTEALSQAQMILVARKDATVRIDSMTLNLQDTTDVNRVVAGLEMDIFSLVNISKTMPGGSVVTRELFVQGVQHDITPRSWNSKFLTSEPIFQSFILDSVTTQGQLDTGILSY
jgi:hypothetical protein